MKPLLHPHTKTEPLRGCPLGPNVGSVLHYFATAALATLAVFAEVNVFAQEVHYSPEERLDAIVARRLSSTA
jgi:hypothetical protein